MQTFWWLSSSHRNLCITWLLLRKWLHSVMNITWLQHLPRMPQIGLNDHNRKKALNFSRPQPNYTKQSVAGIVKYQHLCWRTHKGIYSAHAALHCAPSLQQCSRTFRKLCNTRLSWKKLGGDSPLQSLGFGQGRTYLQTCLTKELKMAMTHWH